MVSFCRSCDICQLPYPIEACCSCDSEKANNRLILFMRVAVYQIEKINSKVTKIWVYTDPATLSYILSRT